MLFLSMDENSTFNINNIDHDYILERADFDEDECEKIPTNVSTNRIPHYRTLSLTCFATGHCGQTFTSKPELDKHLLEIHSKQNFKCHGIDCGSSTNSAISLNAHLELNHGGQSEWPCELCDKVLPNNQNLGRHYRTCHDEGIFECKVEQCQARFNRRIDAYLHYRKTHELTRVGQHQVKTKLDPEKLVALLQKHGIKYDLQDVM